MKKNILLKAYWMLVVVIGGFTTLHAQTITTGTISPTSICPGSQVDVAFTRTGTFAANIGFKVQLSTGGEYSEIPTAGTTSPLKATIPSATPAGTTYKLRVVAVNTTTNSVTVTGTPSATAFAVKSKPAPPTGDAVQYECQRVAGTIDVTFDFFVKGEPNAKIKVYDERGNEIGIESSTMNGNTYSISVPGNSGSGPVPTYEKKYSITQIVGDCESDKFPITLVVRSRYSTGPSPTNSTNTAPYIGSLQYCQGDSALPLNINGHSSPPAGFKVGYSIEGVANSDTFIPPVPNTKVSGTTTYLLYYAPINPDAGCRSSPTYDSRLVVTVSPRPAKPVVANTAVTYCQNQTATALTATGQNLKWYNAATGGNVVPSTPDTKTAGTFKYYVSQTTNGCESERTEITVEVKPTAPAPTVAPVNYCAGGQAVPLTAIATSGGTLQWYGLDGSKLAAPPTPVTTATGVTSYSVSQTVGTSCESPKAIILVTVNQIPSAPTATTAVAYCQNAQAIALNATGQNLKWYEVSTAGTSAASITPDTKVTGTKTYYVSQTVNGCEGPRTAIIVNVNPLPAPPTGTQTTLSYCQGENIPVLSATAVTGGTLLWSGPGVTNATVAPKPSSTSAGTFEYTVSQRINGCESEPVKITITVKSKPELPGTKAVIACLNTPVSPLDQNVTKDPTATLTWYTSTTGVSGVTAVPTPPTSSTGTISYYITQTVNGCTSDRAKLDFTVNPLPGKPTITPVGPYCQGESAPALKAVGTAIKWYDSKGAVNTAPTPSTDQPGTQIYLASQTVNTCEGPRDSVVITVKRKPGKPGVTNPAVEFCQNTKAPELSATPEASAKLNWFNFNGASSATIPVIPNSNATSYTFRVSQTLDGCTSDQTEIKVTVNPTPVAPTVTIDRPVVCQKEAAVPLKANGEGLKWYASDSTTVVPNATQSTDNAGTFVYFVSQTLKACEGPKTKTQIRVKPLPSAPTIATNKEVCQDAPIETLQAGGQNIKWFDIDNNPLGDAPKPSTNVEQGVTYIYKTTQTVDGCESDKLTVNYKVNVTPKPTVVTPVIYCQNATAKPLEATGTNLKWINPYGGETTTTPVPPTTNISTKPEGDSYFVTQTGTNGCESRKSEIKLIVNAPPTAKIEGTTTVNLGNTVPVTISFTSVPPFSYTLSDGTSGTSTTMQKEITLLPTSKTTIYRVTNITNSCGAGTPVGTFTVNAVVPTVTTSPLSVTTICVGTQIQVPFTAVGPFTAGNTFRVEMAPVADTAFINKTEILTGALQSPITAPIPTTLAQGLYRIRVTATNPQVPVPGSSSPTILNIRALPTVTLTGSKDIYDNEGTPLSFALTGDGPWTFAYSDSLKTTQITTSTNPHLITVTPVKSTTYKAVSVSNGCGNGTATGTAIVRVLPVLGLEPDPLITAVKVFPVPTETILTIDIDLPLQKDPAKLQLSDETGRVSKQLTTRQRQTKLDLSQQAAGTYFLQIQIGNRTTVRKIMKQ